MKSGETLQREYARMRVKTFNDWLAAWQARYDGARSDEAREKLTREKRDRYATLREDLTTKRRPAQSTGRRQPARGAAERTA